MNQRRMSKFHNSIVFLLFFLCQLAFLIQLVECGRISTTTPKPKPDNKNQPGRVKQTFTGNESSWVPGVSAAVIVLIVFLISIFACCIHCPFCIYYRRSNNQAI